jgi:aryl-alcohol dehydrogenase-like predicted oxidoreductase
MAGMRLFDALFGAEAFPRNLEVVDELKGIAAKYGRSLPQVALRWAISHPAVSTALVGCRNTAEVEDNAHAVEFSLTDEDLAEMDAIFSKHGVDPVPDYWIEDA